MEMYTEVILDYYKHPRNFGEVADAQIKEHDTNPLCGDEIEVTARLNGNKIEEARFNGHGCAISQAAAGMLTEEVKGKSLQQFKKMTKGELLKLLGIELSAARMKCALLAFKVLKVGVYKHLGEKIPTRNLD